MMINVNILIPLDKIHVFCAKYPICKLALFGSVITDDFRDDSDIDILIEFASGVAITDADMRTMETELSDTFGREVDLCEPTALDASVRRKIVDEAGLLYVVE